MDRAVQWAIKSYTDGCEHLPPIRPHPILDAWGHAIRYRAPGPVHKVGYDVYSLGPDGVDDHGAGDDILFGQDFAPVASR